MFDKPPSYIKPAAGPMYVVAESEELATLRAQLAEVTRERDDRIEAIIRAHDALRDGRGHDAFVALNEYAVIGRIAKEPKP